MKTPAEIKKGLECCYGDKERRLCEKCPNGVMVEGYSELICTDFDSLGENALTYIKQLESERDEAVEELQCINKENDRKKGCVTCMHFTPGYFLPVCRNCRLCDKWEWYKR